jgi:hypothetical protein
MSRILKTATQSSQKINDRTLLEHRRPGRPNDGKNSLVDGPAGRRPQWNQRSPSWQRRLHGGPSVTFVAHLSPDHPFVTSRTGHPGSIRDTRSSHFSAPGPGRPPLKRPAARTSQAGRKVPRITLGVRGRTVRVPARSRPPRRRSSGETDNGHRPARSPGDGRSPPAPPATGGRGRRGAVTCGFAVPENTQGPGPTGPRPWWGGRYWD